MAEATPPREAPPPAEAPTVTVTYYAALAARTGLRTEILPVAQRTVGGLLDAVATRHGETLRPLLRTCSVLDVDTLRRDPAAPISDTVDLLPPFAGG